MAHQPDDSARGPHEQTDRVRVVRGRGDLEAAVLRVLWDSPEPLTSREVQAAITAPQPALTTLLTVLDRLRTKGLVTRSPGRGPYTFSPTRSESEHAVEAMLTSLTATSDRRAALLTFAGHLDPTDADVLRRALDPAPSKPRRGRRRAPTED